MKKNLHRALIPGLLAMMVSCHKPVPSPEADLFLDELEDRTELTESLVVDCSQFDREQTMALKVNEQVYASPFIVEMDSPGYYRFELTTHENKPPTVIRIVILDEERAEADWGLPSWVPEGVEIGTVSNQVIQTVYPKKIPAGYSMPVVVIEGEELASSTNNFLAHMGNTSFLVKRGVGSAWIPAEDQASGSLVLDHRSFPLEPSEFTGEPVTLTGEIVSSLVISAESHVHIPADVTIGPGISLIFEEGCFISVAPEVNIYSQGEIQFSGSAELPITMTCSENDSFWGGVLSTGSGNVIRATHTIFAGSGYHTGEDYNWGHGRRQALFYSDHGIIQLEHCYMIDHIGQILFPNYTQVTLNSCLIQRARTGGQANHCQVLIDRTVFTDFPNDSKQYQDEDNDGFYLSESNADITHSVFMYAKDDGLDSGGYGEGDITVSHCRFEACFHEGAALSSLNTVEKHHLFRNCIFTDCGQGLELGFSSPNHLVEVDSCRFIKNGIGIRFGDCYAWQHDGLLSVSNSHSLDNVTYDIWNMVRELWNADTAHMEFENVWISKASSLYPDIQVYE